MSIQAIEKYPDLTSAGLYIAVLRKIEGGVSPSAMD
jgi:hypothetical protein